MKSTFREALTAPVNINLCKWAVCYDIGPEEYDDKQSRTSVVAVFGDPYQAEDFILKCLPAENFNRFYIVHI